MLAGLIRPSDVPRFISQNNTLNRKKIFAFLCMIFFSLMVLTILVMPSNYEVQQQISTMHYEEQKQKEYAKQVLLKKQKIEQLKKEHEENYQLIDKSQELVHNFLKDPDSAKFNYDDRVWQKQYSGKNLALISGSVSATNSFNARLSQKYIVVINKDTYNILFFSLDDNVIINKGEGASYVKYVLTH